MNAPSEKTGPVDRDPVDRDPVDRDPVDRRSWIALAAAVCAIAWRAPIVWLEPRFWGEEGALYFAYARQQDLLASLFFVPTSDFPAGYLLLAASLPATLAARVPLELAPRITTLFAFLVQLAPVALVLFSRSPLWPSRGRRRLAAGVLVFAPAVVGEVWLNTINSQVFCGLTAAMILLADPERRWMKRGLLVFCGLSGPYTAFLAPVFWLKTRIARSAEARIEASIVLACAALQASIFAWTTLTYPLAPERFEAGRWALRGAAAAYHFVLRSLVGDTLGLRFAELLGVREPLGTIADAYWLPPPTAAAGPLAGWVALGVLAGLAIFLGRRAHPYAHLLTVALVLSGVLITLSIGHLYVAGRYAVMPGTLLLLRVAVLAWSDRAAPWRRQSARVVLAVGLLAGIAEFRGESPPGVFGLAPGRPSWTQEVATWRQDPSYALRIWAYNLDVPNRLVLSASESPDAVALEASPFELISTGQWARRRLPGPLSPDFRLVVDLEASRALGEVDLEMRWLDREEEPILSWPLRACAASEPCRITLERQDLRGPGPALREAIALELALRSAPAEPARVVVTRLRLARRLEGALEPLLTTRGASGRRRPLQAGEATVLAMAESWRLDRDLRFTAEDLERARRRFGAGARLDLKRQGDHLAYRGSPLHALTVGTLIGDVGDARGWMVLLDLAFFGALAFWAVRRGVAPTLAVAALLASWSGVLLFFPSATWIQALLLWAGLVTGLGPPSPSKRPAVAGLAALIALESAVFLPLALLVLLARPPRTLRRGLATLLAVLFALAAVHLLVRAAGGLPWWSAGDAVVLAPEAFEPAETRPLVMSIEHAARRGVAEDTALLWGIPDTFFGPLFAYPLALVWLLAWVWTVWRRAPRERVLPWALLLALAISAALAALLEPASRAGPAAWAALSPLLLLLPVDWPRPARRVVLGLALLFILVAFRSIL